MYAYLLLSKQLEFVFLYIEKIYAKILRIANKYEGLHKFINMPYTPKLITCINDN